MSSHSWSGSKKKNTNSCLNTPWGTGPGFKLSNLDHCVVINMHWKVLCLCWSRGSPSPLCVYVKYIVVRIVPEELILPCVSDVLCCVDQVGWRPLACLICQKGNRATTVPCTIVRDWRSQDWLVSLQGGDGRGNASLQWDDHFYFFGNRQCLEFCSPLYINLKFFEEGFDRLFVFYW